MSSLDKQKLMQWIEANEYIFSEPYADHEDQIKCEAKLKVMSVLKRDIELGNFNTDEEEPGPRFNMDEHGNLTLIEE